MSIEMVHKTDNQKITSINIGLIENVGSVV